MFYLCGQRVITTERYISDIFPMLSLILLDHQLAIAYPFDICYYTVLLPVSVSSGLYVIQADQSNYVNGTQLEQDFP